MPPKATKKAAAKTPSAQKYEYTELAKVSLSADKLHSVYGVVVDASFPYKQASDKYICSLKIVDPTLHAKGGKPGDDDYATVVIYGKKFEQLPIVTKVGDIIRLHRSSLRMYHGKRQFNVSTHWQGSWAIFGQDDTGFAPTSYSGQRATFEKHEVALITSLRKWVGTYSSSHDMLTKDQYTALSAIQINNKDEDVVAKILSIHEMDAYTWELRISDGSTPWYVLALKLKFPNVRAGQVIYIRSATADATSSKVFSLAPHSNILSLPAGCKLAKAVAAKCKETWEADLKELAKDVPQHAIVLSEVDKKHAGLAQTSLQDLFHNESSLSGSTHRVMLNVVKVEGDAKEACKVFDKKSKKCSSAKGSKGGDLCW